MVFSYQVTMQDAAAATAGTGLFAVPCAGLKQVRARVSAYASGAITVTGFSTVAAVRLGLAR